MITDHESLSAEALSAFLQANIPAYRLLGLQVAACDSRKVILRAPFDLNRNHKATVFGGSQALLATLAGWSLVHTALPEAQGNIVIQESSIRYLKPATADLTATACAIDDADWLPFQTAFLERGKSKICLRVILSVGETTVSEFQGKFVVLKAA